MTSTSTSEASGNQEQTCIPKEQGFHTGTKVVLYAGIDVTVLATIRNTLENTLEHLGKDTRST